MSGTVVEKLVDEGKYIKTGMPILRIADLSKVWLILKMFPEETSNLKIGQSVTVSIFNRRLARQFAGGFLLLIQWLIVGRKPSMFEL